MVVRFESRDERGEKKNDKIRTITIHLTRARDTVTDNTREKKLERVVITQYASCSVRTYCTRGKPPNGLDQSHLGVLGGRLDVVRPPVSETEIFTLTYLYLQKYRMLDRNPFRIRVGVVHDGMGADGRSRAITVVDYFNVDSYCRKTSVQMDKRVCTYDLSRSHKNDRQSLIASYAYYDETFGRVRFYDVRSRDVMV